MASNAARSRKRQRDVARARLRGEDGEKEAEVLLQELLRQRRISWFVRSLILDARGIDFLVGLVLRGKKVVCDIDVLRSSNPSAENKKIFYQQKHGRIRPRFKPDFSGSINQRANRLFDFLKERSVPTETLFGTDWNKLFGQRNRKLVRNHFERYIRKLRRNEGLTDEDAAELRKRFEQEWQLYFKTSLYTIEKRGGAWNHFCLVAEHADEETRTAVREEVDRLRKEVELANNARVAAKCEEKQKRERRLVELREIVCGKLKAAGIDTDAAGLETRDERDGRQHNLELAVEEYFSNLGKRLFDITDGDIDEHLLKLLEKIDIELAGWRMFKQIPELLPLYTAFQEEQAKKMRVAREEEENRGREEVESIVVVENTPPALQPVLLSWRQKVSAFVRRLGI